MAGVQAELLKISSEIALCKPVAVTAVGRDWLRTRWVTTSVIPGLAVVTAFGGVSGTYELTKDMIRQIDLSVIDPENGDATLPLSLNPTDADQYEDPYAQLFLDSFARYAEEARRSSPANLVGMVYTPLTVDARQLLAA